MNGETEAEELARDLAEEAAGYCDEAKSAIRLAFSPHRNRSIDWEMLARRRLRAALALIGDK